MCNVDVTTVCISVMSMLWVPKTLPAPGKYWCTQPAAIMQAPIMMPAPGKYWYTYLLLLGTNNAATLWQVLVSNTCHKAAGYCHKKLKQKLLAVVSSFSLDDNEQCRVSIR